jgi:hypothetical protein
VMESVAINRGREMVVSVGLVPQGTTKIILNLIFQLREIYLHGTGPEGMLKRCRDPDFGATGAGSG